MPKAGIPEAERRPRLATATPSCTPSMGTPLLCPLPWTPPGGGAERGTVIMLSTGQSRGSHAKASGLTAPGVASSLVVVVVQVELVLQVNMVVVVVVVELAVQVI